MDEDDREKIDFKGVSRVWMPRLVELTKAPHPEVNEGAPTKMYVDPKIICHIERAVVQWQLVDGTKVPKQECTVVTTTRSFAHVLESPEEIARRVNAAMVIAS